MCFNYTFVMLKRKGLVFFFTEEKMYSDNKATSPLCSRSEFKFTKNMTCYREFNLSPRNVCFLGSDV